jgi:hypothetical protein
MHKVVVGQVFSPSARMYFCEYQQVNAQYSFTHESPMLHNHRNSQSEIIPETIKSTHVSPHSVFLSVTLTLYNDYFPYNINGLVYAKGMNFVFCAAKTKGLNILYRNISLQSSYF